MTKRKKKSTVPGENRRITSAMIQWAEEHGACQPALRAMCRKPTFRSFFGANTVRQIWVVSELGLWERSVAWRHSYYGSEEKFRAFMDIINQWEIR